MKGTAMNESTLKRLRFVPVVLALGLVVAWWLLVSPKKTVLVFSTGSDVGLYHRLASRMKTVIEDGHPDIVIQLQASAGSNENIERLDAGRAHLALVQNDARGGNSVRSMAALYPEVLHRLCRKSVNLQSLTDLGGRRIGIGARRSGTEQLTRSLLEFADVEVGTGQVSNGSFGDAIGQLREGELDAAFFLTGLGAEAISKALADDRLSLAPIQMHSPANTDPEEIADRFTSGFRVHYPHVSPRTIPLMAYGGRPTAPVPSMSVQAVFVCHVEVEPRIIERITSTLFEQRAVLSQKEPAFTHLDEQLAQARLQFPLHEGAENFYRRREPGFLAENAESMGFILTMMLLVWSVLIWARRFYLQARKNRIDVYYSAVDSVMHQLNEATDVRTLGALDSELTDVHLRASAELVRERLAADESYIIYQNMFNWCQSMLVRRREEILASSGNGGSI